MLHILNRATTCLPDADFIPTAQSTQFSYYQLKICCNHYHHLESMILPPSIKRSLALLGYQNQWPYDHLYNQARRTSCILSTILIILPTFYKCAFETGTLSDQIRSLLGFMCGFSSLAYFSIMLWSRRSILDVFAKLQLKVNERTVAISIQFSLFF